MSTVFKSIREDFLAGCNLSFRKGVGETPPHGTLSRVSAK